MFVFSVLNNYYFWLHKLVKYLLRDLHPAERAFPDVVAFDENISVLPSYTFRLVFWRYLKPVAIQ
jgi:hypothetical protein